MTWNKLSANSFGVKFKKKGFIFDDTSRSLFANTEDDNLYLTALLNTQVVYEILKILNPTMSFTNGDLKRIPIFLSETKYQSVNLTTKNNWKLVKDFDDSFESSFDFTQHPLL